MFTRIIVPLDGTRFAEAALAPACELSHVFGAKLIITRAVPPYGFPNFVEGALPVIGFGDLGAFDRKQQVIEATDSADAYLHAMAETLRVAGYNAELLVELAVPGQAISLAAEQEHADLIVMSSHLRWKVPAQTTTSATLDVLVQSRVPLLAWRVADEMTESEISPDTPAVVARPNTPIIVPLDGSMLAESALPTAQNLAHGLGTFLVLVRATEREEELADGLAYLQKIRGEIMREGMYVQCVCRVGSPLSVIETVWREFNGSVIVMASRGRLGPHGTFFGSTAARMLEMAEAPILVVRPPEPLAVETGTIAAEHVEP